MSEKPVVGSVTWRDLTIEHASQLQEFYQRVIGWEVDAAQQDGYDDYVMSDVDGEPVAGICHARGPNAELPPQWLIYITVADLDESMRQCLALGGQIVCPPRDMGGYGATCVIRDPVGAVAALIQPPD